MRYTVKWERCGRVFEAKAEGDAAKFVFQAILAFYSGDEIKVQLWDGAKLVQESLS